MQLRTFVASGYGQALIFKINRKGKIVWSSPMMPKARGQHILNLRTAMRAKGFAFYEVIINPSPVEA